MLKGSPFMNFNFSFDLDLDADENEMNGMRNRMKTDEEIKECSTQEDLTITQKGSFIMRKGYEVQKKSVVSHMARYLVEPESNDELLPLILNSIETWDVEF